MRYITIRTCCRSVGASITIINYSTVQCRSLSRAFRVVVTGTQAEPHPLPQRLSSLAAVCRTLPYSSVSSNNSTNRRLLLLSQQERFCHSRCWTTATTTKLNNSNSFVLLPTAQQQQRLLQPISSVRYFGKGLQPRNHGKKHGFTNDEVKLQICYSDYDLDLDQEADDFDEDIQDMTFVRCKFHMNDIRETVEEIFDDSRNMQYHYDAKKQWRPLTDLSTAQMQQYRGGKKVLKVRVPDHYDDTPMGEEDDIHPEFNLDSDDDDDDDDDSSTSNINKKSRRRRRMLKQFKENAAMNLDLKSVILEGTIKRLVTKLKDDNYVRCGGVIYGETGNKIIYSIIHTETNEKMLTRDFVLNEAKIDRDLSRMLLAVIGSFDHIVKCIHYDLLWEHEKRPKRLHNGYRRW